jgi:hypothetical protein
MNDDGNKTKNTTISSYDLVPEFQTANIHVMLQQCN